MRKFRIWKLLPVLALVLVLLATGVTADETSFDKENFVGLVLRNTETSTVTVKLYSGFTIDSANLQTPVYTEGGDQYYTVQPNSRYYCVAKPTSGYARYNDQYCIYITAAEAEQKTVMDVTPQKRNSNGWDTPNPVLHYTDETMTNIYKTDPALWPQYAHMFTTPAFQSGRTQHRQTTHTEMMAFLDDLDDADDKMSVYIIGKSDGDRAAERIDIPMVVFTTTDLSAATTLEEAAALVQANGKLTVLYQAQIHGDEPASCEAALGMIKHIDGAYGDDLLDKMNICVIPRLNPSGAYNSRRTAELADGTTTDPNRDFMKLTTQEAQARTRVYNLFKPEVVFDNHEYQTTNTYNRIKWKDMSLCCHPLPIYSQQWQSTAVAMAYAAYDQLEKDGLTYRWYSDGMGGYGTGTGSCNIAYRGSIHILMETDGCDRGKQFYERRVVAHASAVSGILDYLQKNADAVNKTVNDQWNTTVENGKTYREDDIVILDGASTDAKEYYLKGKYILLDSGTIEANYVDFPASYPNDIKRSRPAPTAYVLPADLSNIDSILALMEKHNISYDFIPGGSRVNLQQYTALTEVDGVQVADLTPEQQVSFPSGAYVFTMTQTDAYILAVLMEPDCTDSLANTLVGQGYITASQDKYPIYRYVHDLNEQGKIDLVTEDFDTENFKGLVLVNTASGVSVTLYNGYADNAPEITPVYTEGNAAYYEVVAGGKYKYVAKPVSGYSHYHIRKNIYISAEEAQQKQILDVTPPVRTPNGWDPWEVIKAYSDEAMAAAFPSDPDMWPKYKHLFTTPLFDEGRFPHRQTTQTEMMDYINGLDDTGDNMYVYILGKSGGAKAAEQFDIPVVFFTKTDLSGATTWEEAAALMKANGKLTFMYQAQIHSKEPGNGEAALAMLRDFDGDYGEGLLDNMNLCVIPRLNTWGAYKSKRTVYLNGSEVDANRDFMQVKTVEVQLRNHLYNAVEPEVYYDAHECNLHPEYENVSMRDVWISTNFTPKATAEFKNTALTVCYEIFDRAEENNLTYGWYSSSINGYNPSMSTTNVAMRGSLVFLNESHGIWGGMQQIERRIMSHVSVVTAILDYINENTAAVQKVVDDQRADIVNRGKTYEESDIIVLQSDYTMHPEYYINGKQVDTGSGMITDTVLQGKIYDVVKASRPAPTAYVIPAGQSWTAEVLEKLDIHGISYTKLPAAAVQLQQYTGTTSAATLTAERTVSFPKGAYVMTMAQEDAYILALLMEPDVKDLAENKGTFAQMGLIPVSGSTFPIYRYIRDLNADGSITYTEITGEPDVPAKPYTIYLDSANGSADGSGYSETTAVNTLELAHSQLDTLMAEAPAGTTGTIVILGTYTITGTSNTVYMPKHEYPLLITGGTLIYKDVSGNKHLCLGGDTTFDDITMGVGTASDSYFLFGMGHKLVIGENVTIKPYTSGSTSYYFAVAGGSNGTVAKTDLTIKSGYWYTVYAGGRNGKVTGDCRLELSNCSVTRAVASRASTIQGNVEIYLENMTARSGVFCGNTTSGNVEGNVTLVLGQGVNAGTVYAGSNTAGNVNGTVTVIADGIDLTTNTIHGKANNDTGTIGGLALVLNQGQLADAATFLTRDGVAVTLGCDQTEAVTIPYDTDLDLNGHNASNVTVADGKTLTVKDTGDTLGVLSATGNVIAAEGYEEKTVTGGKSYPEKTAVTVLPGDMDGNSEKNTEDAVYLLLHVLFGEGQYPIDSAADRDLNNDNKVDTEDAVYLLLNVLFGENQYPI